MSWTIREKASDEFYHYGIKGMKWGVRKEYAPKGKGRRTGSDSWVEDFKRKNTKTVKTENGITTIQYLDPQTFTASRIVLGVIDKTDRYAVKEEAKEILDNLPKQKTKLTEDEQILATNHDGYDDIRLINCFECSMAYEMRMRGYDVQAREMPGGLTVESKHAFAVTDGFSLKVKPNDSTPSDKQALAEEAYKQMEKQCLAYGDGARGCLGIQYYDYDSGHSMYWMVENGTFKIVDSQQSGRNGYEIFLHADTEKGVTVDRLDNAEVLPGVIDFIEPYAMTEEEIAEQERLTKERIEKLRAAKKESDKKKAEKLRLADEKATAIRDKEIYEGKSTFQKVVGKVTKTTKSLIKRGKNAILDIFDPQYKEVGGHKFKVKRK